MGLVGVAWISCQHPHFNICSCCSSCCDPNRRSGPAWDQKGEKDDIEMAQVGSVFSQQSQFHTADGLGHAAGRRGPSYEAARPMRVVSGSGDVQQSRHEHARSTTQLLDGGDSSSRPQRKHTRIERWLRDQSHTPRAQPDLRPTSLRHPKPVHLSHGHSASVGQLQAEVASPDPTQSHRRGLSYPTPSRLHQAPHLSNDSRTSQPLPMVHSGHASVAESDDLRLAYDDPETPREAILRPPSPATIRSHSSSLHDAPLQLVDRRSPTPGAPSRVNATY